MVAVLLITTGLGRGSCGIFSSWAERHIRIKERGTGNLHISSVGPGQLLSDSERFIQATVWCHVTVTAFIWRMPDLIQLTFLKMQHCVSKAHVRVCSRSSGMSVLLARAPDCHWRSSSPTPCSRWKGSGNKRIQEPSQTHCRCRPMQHHRRLEKRKKNRGQHGALGNLSPNLPNLTVA